MAGLTRVQAILQRVRDSLADPNQERYTNARLLRLIDEGQKAIAREFSLLKSSTRIEIVKGTSTYTLPSDLWRITRAMINEKPVDLVSYDNLDDRNPSWYTSESPTPEAVVYNLRNIHEIRVYPIPTRTPQRYDFNSPFGVLVGSTRDFLDVIFNQTTGVVTDVTDSDYLNIQYIQDPALIDSEQDELQISAVFDVALRFYTIAHAFLDDLDSQNSERAETALGLYNQQLAVLGTQADMTDNTRTSQYTTPYRNGFQ